MLYAIPIAAILAGLLFLLCFALRKDGTALLPSLSSAIFVAIALEFFDLLAISQPQQFYVWKKFSLVTESLLAAVWFWFAITYARKTELRSVPLYVRLLLAASPLLACFALFVPIRWSVYSPDFAVEKMVFLGNAGFALYLLILVYLVIALINLELTLVHTTPVMRWKIKFELLGAGAYLTMMIIYYSQAFIFRAINMQLTTTRAVLLITAVALMTYSRMKRGVGVKVYVSHQMAYRSVVLLVIGLYVIGLGVAGEGMRYFGDGFQRAMIMAVALLAGLGLCVVLFSETARRKTKVFIHKHFYQHKYDYRNQWLQFTDRLSSSNTSDELLRSIVAGFCETFGMGSGTLFIINQERDSYQHAAGSGADDIAFSIKDSAIQCLSGNGWILDLRDNVIVLDGSQHSGFFKEQSACFIIPLYMHEGLDGFIMLGRPLICNEIYTYEDFDLMRTLARQASSALLNLRLSEQLSRSRELAALGKVSAFVMHDLKNLVSVVSITLDNAKQHIALPEFQQDMLASMEITVTRMKTLISRLRHLPAKNSLQRAPIDLLQMAHETAAMVKGPALQVTGTHVMADGDLEELQKVALNLMMNAVEATNGSKPVQVEVGERETPYFRVKDEGCGIPDAYLQNVLFKPFSSTKKHGLGIGLYQSKQIVEAHGGTIEVVSRVNQGSEFTVWLPKLHPGTVWQEGGYGKTAHC